MATRQGITGQLTQSADDARRSIMNSAPQAILSHRWFSNMNTTCTIKSAPPRTPEVMTLLSSQSGWLVKRNEQGVWQRRYCCVVPHTFLYYFDSEPCSYNTNPQQQNYSGGNGGSSTPGGTSSSAGGGYSLPWPNHNSNNTGEHTDSGETRQYDEHTNNNATGPVGIIDLECYSQINRVKLDDHANTMELTGDAVTNPDLRSFFFQGDNPEECEIWTTALLSDRHQALRDEREAYKQVCESFPIQLAEMSKIMDEAESKANEREMEAYQVRSSAEEGRKMIIELVRECIEKLTVTAGAGGSGGGTGHGSANASTPHGGARKLVRTNSSGSVGSNSMFSSSPVASSSSGHHHSHHRRNGSNKTIVMGRLADEDAGDTSSSSHAFRSKLAKHQSHFLSKLDSILSQNHHRIMGGAPESVSLLINLMERLIHDFYETHSKLKHAESELQKRHVHSQSEFIELEEKVKRQASRFAQKESTFKNRIVELENTLHTLTKEKMDVEQMMQNATMEHSLYTKNTKSKLKELVEHRRILKKEVIDLRSQVENTKSEMDVLKHQKSVLSQKFVDEKRRRSGLSENYNALREQLSVQERVWGMMQSSLNSVAGGSVVHGGGGGSVVGPGGGGGSVAPGGGGGGSVVASPVPPMMRDIIHAVNAGGSVGPDGVGMGEELESPVGMYGKRFHPRDVVVRKRVVPTSPATIDDDNKKVDDDDNGSVGSRGSDPSVTDIMMRGDVVGDDRNIDKRGGRTGTRRNKQHGAGDGDGGARDQQHQHHQQQRELQNAASFVPPLHPKKPSALHTRTRSAGELSCDVMSEITTDVPFMMSTTSANRQHDVVSVGDDVDVAAAVEAELSPDDVLGAVTTVVDSPASARRRRQHEGGGRNHDDWNDDGGRGRHHHHHVLDRAEDIERHEHEHGLVDGDGDRKHYHRNRNQGKNRRKEDGDDDEVSRNDEQEQGTIQMKQGKNLNNSSSNGSNNFKKDNNNNNKSKSKSKSKRKNTLGATPIALEDGDAHSVHSDADVDVDADTGVHRRGRERSDSIESTNSSLNPSAERKNSPPRTLSPSKRRMMREMEQLKAMKKVSTTSMLSPRRDATSDKDGTNINHNSRGGLHTIPSSSTATTSTVNNSSSVKDETDVMMNNNNNANDNVSNASWHSGKDAHMSSTTPLSSRRMCGIMLGSDDEDERGREEQGDENHVMIIANSGEEEEEQNENEDHDHDMNNNDDVNDDKTEHSSSMLPPNIKNTARKQKQKQKQQGSIPQDDNDIGVGPPDTKHTMETQSTTTTETTTVATSTTATSTTSRMGITKRAMEKHAANKRANNRVGPPSRTKLSTEPMAYSSTSENHPPPPYLPMSGGVGGRRELEKRPQQPSQQQQQPQQQYQRSFPPKAYGHVGEDGGTFVTYLQQHQMSSYSAPADERSVVSARSSSSVTKGGGGVGTKGVRSDMSVQTTGTARRPSLAERARMEAESPEFSQAVKIPTSPAVFNTPSRLIGGGGRKSVSTPSTPRGGIGSGGNGNIHQRSPSTGSFLSMLGSRLNDAIDNSVLGVKTANEVAAANASHPPPPPPPAPSSVTRDINKVGSSSASYSTPMSSQRKHFGGDDSKRNDEVTKTPLHIRQQIQREKQLAFLKERGLLK